MMQARSKGDNDSGQGDSGQGSKTGMGIGGPIMNAYALLIGVGNCKYTDWSLPVSSLDARELRQTLADPTLCAYPAEQIRVLSDEQATRNGILQAIDELAQKPADQGDATVLIYYSGHGWRQKTDGGERFFLIPHDVNPMKLTESALPAEDFVNGLRKIRARRVLMLLDTCHAAGMAEAKDAVADFLPDSFSQEALPEALIQELSQGEGRAVFLSCRESQKSWILPDDGSLSIFTHHLLAGLRGAAAAPDDTTVTVSGLMGYLSNSIPVSAQEIGKEQTPFFKFETEDFPVALVRGGKGLPESGAIPEAPAPIPTVSVGNIKTGGDSFVAGQIGSITTRSSK